MSHDGELMLSILAGFAQEESRSASENQKWRIRHSYASGEVLQWRHLYGYRIHKDQVSIVPEQARIVREIFQRVLAGESYGAISRDLNARQVPSTFGCKWTISSLSRILRCEKYQGDALLQKRYVNNHLEKKECRNQGELPQYYVRDSHPAIIDRNTFAAVQKQIQIRSAAVSGKVYQTSVFTGKITCGHCGKHYRRVTVRGKSHWNCRTFQNEGKSACPAKAIPEDILRELTAGVLGTVSFDQALFDERIDHLLVAEAHQLIFFMKDGTRIVRNWQPHSRKESWTPAMKEAARKKAVAQRRSR